MLACVSNSFLNFGFQCCFAADWHFILIVVFISMLAFEMCVAFYVGVGLHLYFGFMLLIDCEFGFWF